MEPSKIPVLILAGGRGTRLSGVTDLPKALIRVAGRPFIIYLLAALHRQGFRRLFFLTGYGADIFERVLCHDAPEARPGFLDDLELRFLVEEQPLGTGGALRQALPHVEGRALVLNADSYCSLDCLELLRLLEARSALFCLAAVAVEDAGDYGSLTLDEDGLVQGFAEKGAGGPGWINAGVYALERRFLERAIPEFPCSLERDVLPRWVQGEPTPAWCVRGFFRDIGTPERLEQAQQEFPPDDLAWLE